jgi:hypothetical protein
LWDGAYREKILRWIGPAEDFLMQTRVESGQIRLARTLEEHLQRFLEPLLIELDRNDPETSCS